MWKSVFLILLFKFCDCADPSVNTRYYPRYHLAPELGWMNDPNGFSVFNNEYHLFYQYNPWSSLEAGYAHWGHAKSPDLVTWEHLPVALYPNNDYDTNGVFSGSAIVEDGTMYVYYTTNLNHPGETPDHEQHQALATSTDGVFFTKDDNNPIIVNEDLQPNIRDPKVWSYESKYYMVLGNSVDNTYGRALLFTSGDKLNWTQASVLAQSDGTTGYMYECPDFFELNGKFVLLFSPQGITANGDNYRNLHQTGYIVGSFDYNTNKFTPETTFRELDHGHDFYATQTIKNGGDRIMVAWFDMWEQVYPEREDGFTGMITLPRILTLSSDNRLIQKPIPAIESARGPVLFNGRLAQGRAIKLQDNAGSVTVTASKSSTLQLIVSSGSNANPVKITYNPAGTVTLDRGGTDGVRRTQWIPSGDTLKWKVFVDASAIELFCGDGEVTFSSRFFPDGDVSVGLSQGTVRQMMVTSMKRTVPVPPSSKPDQPRPDHGRNPDEPNGPKPGKGPGKKPERGPPPPPKDMDE